MHDKQVHYFVLDGWPGKLRTDEHGVMSASITNSAMQEVAVQVHEVTQSGQMLSYKEYEMLVKAMRKL